MEIYDVSIHIQLNLHCYCITLTQNECFITLQNSNIIHTGNDTHLASYSVDMVVFFLISKAAGHAMLLFTFPLGRWTKVL